MADRQDSSPPGSCASSEAESGSSSSSTPPYTPDEIAAIFLELYQSLTTLHFDAADLKIAPPGGWPGLTAEFCAGFKSDLALEVLRRLPYFGNRSKAAIHYKSRLIDYTSLDQEHFKTGDWNENCITFKEDDEEYIPQNDTFFIAWGRESFGRDLLLDVKNGEISESMVRADICSPVDVKDFFDNLKEEYRSLKLIPCLGRITMDAWNMEERDEKGEISEEEVLAQTKSWGTDLDVHYVRQLYRQHGWPDAFLKDEARKAIDVLMDSMREQRYEWGPDLEDW